MSADHDNSDRGSSRSAVVRICLETDLEGRHRKTRHSAYGSHSRIYVLREQEPRFQMAEGPECSEHTSTNSVQDGYR